MVLVFGVGIVCRIVFKFCIQNFCQGWFGQLVIELFDFDVDVGDYQLDCICCGCQVLINLFGNIVKMLCQVVFWYNVYFYFVGYQYDVCWIVLIGGNQYVNFVINSLFYGGVILVVGVVVVVECEQQVGDYGGDVFQ